jgi:SagB-type dehydrogenase family enzyme
MTLYLILFFKKGLSILVKVIRCWLDLIIVPDLDQKEKMQELREFLKDSRRKTFDFSKTDQSRGVRPPPVEKPIKMNQRVIELSRVGEWRIKGVEVEKAIGDRSSRRSYSNGSLTLNELSFLLWATQGVKSGSGGERVFRVVPSAGCRHSFETYVVTLNVDGFEKGVYRYLPISHRLVEEYKEPSLRDRLIKGTLGQRFVGDASVVFVWTTIPYRMEWRYGEVAHKVIALDAGHVCQNLYLACEAIDAGTCAIGAYDQEEMDDLLGLDGVDEFTIYLAPVGKKISK